MFIFPQIKDQIEEREKERQFILFKIDSLIATISVFAATKYPGPALEHSII